MRLSIVLGTVGRLLLVFTLAFLPPLGLAAWDAWQADGAWWEVAEFAIAMGATLVAGLLLSNAVVSPRKAL